MSRVERMNISAWERHATNMKGVNMNAADPRNSEKHALKKVVDVAVEPRRHSKRNLAKHMKVRNPRNSVEHYLI